MEYEIVIVGAGPAGLAAAIRLKQLRPATTVCIIEKGSRVGAHLLAGAVLDPHALEELLPDWKTYFASLLTPVIEDQFLLLTQHRAFRLPTPPPMQNHGNQIIRLGQLAESLAGIAEKLGVDIYPGFAATEIHYDAAGRAAGIITGDKGSDRGILLKARYIVLAEGCRGSLTKTVIDRFSLCAPQHPQTYGIGIKELWRVLPTQHHAGHVIHSVGWPLDYHTYGGSFIYHLENNLVAVGFVVGCDYQNPTLSPFEEMQRFKTHPAIRSTFEGGERIAYGARSLSEGGWQSLPSLTFPGGLLIGDTAGFLNVPKIKGIHTAMKSGMVAAETLAEALTNTETPELPYLAHLKKSWLWDELYRVRNIRPGFRAGLWGGLAYAALDTYVLRGRAPWTLKNHRDHTQLKKISQCKKIEYPRPDNKITFDILSSVYLSGTHHRNNEASHLHLKNPTVAINTNLALYGAPEQYYCPAKVYEILRNAKEESYLQINAQNCVHCKLCDIKDPTQNITWVPPEGGEGPEYEGM